MNIVNTTNSSFVLLLGLLNFGILIGTFGVVFLANIVYSAIFLGLTFICIALLYLLLNAEFLAITQILIYVGAINVLILFAIMLVNKQNNQKILNKYVNVNWISLFLTFFLIFCFFLMITNTEWKEVVELNSSINDINKIGYELLTIFILPFELLSILLLIALIGAVIIARREEELG